MPSAFKAIDADDIDAIALCAQGMTYRCAFVQDFDSSRFQTIKKTL